jgi:hypothetical protein
MGRHPDRHNLPRKDRMLGSRSAVNVDVLTQAHRISCRVPVGTTGLIGLLNDATTSLLEVEDAYYSRLQQPAKIVAHFETAHIAKGHLALVVLARREDLGSHGLARSAYARQVPVPVLLTTPHFEVQGTVDVAHKFDAAELLIGGTGRFVLVNAASAVATLFPDTTFSGGAILVNRTQVELLTPIPRGKA